MKRTANPAWGLAFAAALLSGSATTPDGEPGLHYLCVGYKKFFRHIRKYLRAMGTLIENDLPVSAVMQAIDGPLIITRNAVESPGIQIAKETPSGR